jgi:hypothetical protein
VLLPQQRVVTCARGIGDTLKISVVMGGGLGLDSWYELAAPHKRSGDIMRELDHYWFDLGVPRRP